MVGLLTVACTSYVKRGSSLYEDGRYIEAAAVLEQAEADLEKSPTNERAKYAAYRGLTLLVLGDLRNAHRWMAYAYQLDRLTPGALDGSVKQELDLGWAELGERMAEGPPQPSLPPTAVAATQTPELAIPDLANPELANPALGGPKLGAPNRAPTGEPARERGLVE
jgi:tetratricopeptide (TPR) repeat protein